MKRGLREAVVVFSVMIGCLSIVTIAHARQAFHPPGPKPAPAPAPPSPTPEQLRNATVPGSYDKPVVMPRQMNGAHGLDAIAGKVWTLVAFGDEPVEPATRAPTISFENGRVAGFSGCNRYSGEAKETAFGVLELGALASTRMACVPAAMEIETAYLTALRAVTAYTLPNDKLVLSGADGDQSKSLVFVLAPEQRD